MSSSWHKYVMVWLGSLLLAAPAWSQVANANIRPKFNSPLSRYGLGDLSDPYFASAAGMGGLGATWQDAFHLNLQNPASLASLQTTAFEGGIYAQYSQLSGRDSSDQFWSGNLRYLALGFSLRNAINRTLDRQGNDWNAGMAFSLAPVTEVGYDVDFAFTDPELGLVTNVLKGTGGLYRFQWANGFRYRQWAAGATVGYLFGEITNSRLVRFDSLSRALTTEFTDDISARGWTWNLGLQYTHDFKKPNDQGEMAPTGKRIIVGVHGNGAQNYNTEVNRYYRRFLSNLSDTLIFRDDEKGRGTLPASITAGVAYQNANKFFLGAEFSQSTWSAYENTSKPENLDDTWRVSVGGEWIPNYLSYNNYWARLRYRFGFYYGLDPRSIDGEQVTRYAVTLGAGFPIVMPRQQVSFLSTSLEVGRFGVADVLQETFVRLSFGFTLNDNSWFFKRKFN